LVRVGLVAKHMELIIDFDHLRFFFFFFVLVGLFWLGWVSLFLEIFFFFFFWFFFFFFFFFFLLYFVGRGTWF